MTPSTIRLGMAALVLLLLAPIPGLSARVFESRESVPEAYKWDLTRFYDGWEEWEAELDEVQRLYDRLAAYEGRLDEGPETLLEAMRLSDRAGEMGGRLFGYAGKVRDLDTRDSQAQARFSELLGVFQRVRSQLAWMNPEILRIPQETVVDWIGENPALEPYRFGLMDTYRTGRYILDADNERILSLHSGVRGAPSSIHSALTNADGDRPRVILEDGRELTVSPGTYARVLNTEPVPADRKTVQSAWMEQFEQRRNTFAAIYEGVLRKGWAEAESRGYGSTLEMELFDDAVPPEVVHSLVEAARSGASELQRYHRLRQRFMGLADYGWSDMFLPLVNPDRIYDYDEVVPEIIDSVAILGEAYHAKMAEQFEGGLVDVYETPGKRSGAYNSAQFGVGSFVLLNYQGSLNDVFTVAHEMGHSMHSRLSQENQPYATHRYTIFVAEVAAILNEKLLLEHLLNAATGPRERIALLETQLKGIAGTFFLQTMMADYEIRAHALVEAGEGISAEILTDLWKAVVEDHFGGLIPKDDPYFHSWARIPHLFNSPFYVYQYATCYASAAAIMQQMRSDPERAIPRYLDLLKSGGSDYPMEQLRKAGVDLTDSSVVQSVVEEFSQLVDRLDSEYTRYRNLE